MKKYFLFFLVIYLVFSCKEDKPKEETILVPSRNETADMNKTWTLEEQEIINQFVERNQWEMTTSESGLRYFIYKEGTGDKAEPGMKAMVEYSISLLDGTEVYSSKEIGPQPFRIENSDVEPGLHEGITYMKVGDKAKIIIPYFLAHGLMGDQMSIPPLTTLIFDIRLLGLSK
ncbi:MAG: FKBP-type peptidyl-prolyl cis-trans isomerase [Flavobacteriales bacterium]|nr:FKBP-type peptidyl-prolyl cis-trans isomerase [Flavobacteriales bacterium]